MSQKKTKLGRRRENSKLCLFSETKTLSILKDRISIFYTTSNWKRRFDSSLSTQNSGSKFIGLRSKDPNDSDDNEQDSPRK